MPELIPVLPEQAPVSSPIEQCGYCRKWTKPSNRCYCVACRRRVCRVCVVIHKSDRFFCQVCAKLLGEKEEIEPAGRDSSGSAAFDPSALGRRTDLIAQIIENRTVKKKIELDEVAQRPRVRVLEVRAAQTWHGVV